MATKWPQVVAALVNTWQGAAGPTDAVYDGPPVGTDVPLRWVTVGWAEDEASASGGSSRRVQEYDGLVWGETGTVLCEIVAQAEDPSLSAVRASAFQFFDTLRSAVEADKSLDGVLSPDATVELATDAWPEADAEAAIFHIRVTVTYTTY